MLQNFITVSSQVLVLFLLILVGFVCGRSKLLPQSAARYFNALVLNVSIPCTLLRAFQVDLTPELLQEFLLALLCSAVMYLVFFPLSHLLIRDPDPHRRRLLTLGSIVSNCNFMGFPLMTAIMGSIGVFYGAAYAGLCPVFLWTVGMIYFNGGLRHCNLKKIFLNPCVLGVTAGFVLFLGQFSLPPLVDTAVSYLADLAVPLPMVTIGLQLSHTDLRRVLRDKYVWLCGGLRLVVIPLLMLVAMVICGIRGDLLLGVLIPAATPPAVMVSMLDKPDSTLGAELVSLHTLCSIATMPLIVALAQTFA